MSMNVIMINAIRTRVQVMWFRNWTHDCFEDWRRGSRGIAGVSYEYAGAAKMEEDVEKVENGMDDCELLLLRMEGELRVSSVTDGENGDDGASVVGV